MTLVVVVGITGIWYTYVIYLTMCNCVYLLLLDEWIWTNIQFAYLAGLYFDGLPCVAQTEQNNIWIILPNTGLLFGGFRYYVVANIKIKHYILNWMNCQRKFSSVPLNWFEFIQLNYVCDWGVNCCINPCCMMLHDVLSFH